MGFKFKLYLSGKTQTGLVMPPILIAIDFCGDESISLLSESPNYDIHINGENWLSTIKLRSTELFSNSRSNDCPI